MRVFRAIFLICILLLAGCATVSVPSPQQQAQAQHADALFAQGNFPQAAQAYMDLAAQHSRADDYYRLRAADAWRENGSLDNAAQSLQGINRKRLQPADAQRYDLLRAEIALKHGDAARALQLAGAPVSGLPPNLRMRAQELRARAQQKTGDAWAAARTRASMDAHLSGFDQSQNRDQIITLLSGMGAPALQQHAATLAPGDPMQRWTRVALEQLGVAVAHAQPALNHPVGTVMPGMQQGQGFNMPQHVALLLPTSGSLAAAGNAVREGFFTAYFDGDQAGKRPVVRVYNTGGIPAKASAAYQQAVADGAQLVIGPLTRDTVTALLAQATLPVPLLALNRADNGVLPPPDVTEFALLPESEGAQAAEHMHDTGLLNAEVIVSTEDFAQRAGKAFKVQFTALGGRVTQMMSLDPTAIDYANQIKSLGVGHAPNSGIFISMRPSQARLLIPQLRLGGLTLPVFATSHIYAGTDDPESDSDLDGVEFCDTPWLLNAQPGLPARSQIAALLPAARGTSGRLFAFGMDAWALAPYLDWLRAHPESYLPGATGQLAEDDFGRITRVPAWARFVNGVAQPVTGSLEMGAPTALPAAAPATDAPAASGSASTPPAAAPITTHP